MAMVSTNLVQLFLFVFPKQSITRDSGPEDAGTNGNEVHAPRSKSNGSWPISSNEQPLILLI